MKKLESIPISWYFDEEKYQEENRQLFSDSSQYVGHTAMVAELNDFYVLHGSKEGYILFHHDDQYSLVSNQCRHHQATLLTGSGNTDRIICPIHRWAYDSKGKMLQASRFHENPCLHLSRHKLQHWHGLLYDGEPAPYDGLADEIVKKLQWDNYRFHSRQEQSYNYNWKLFMEVYLDNYHIPSIHPGLKRLININQQRWFIDHFYSAQFVKLNKHLEQHGSEAYRKYQEIIMEFTQSPSLDHEIMWLAIYPNIMIECYPFMNIVSTVHSHGSGTCVNIVDYFFEKEVLAQVPNLPEIALAAYNETAAEDAIACDLLQEGKKSLFLQGVDESGPHHPEMEMGLPSFHAYLIDKMSEK